MKILAYTDLTISPNNLFWYRDLGLLTKAFRQSGHDAWLVVHPAAGAASKVMSGSDGSPVLWARAREVRDPTWWRNQKPDLAILGLWTRPKYDPVRRAALSATRRVIERADSDGMRTASCGLRTYAQRRYDYFRDRTCRWPAFLSIPASALYGSASILATPWIESRLARTLQVLPAVMVETPHATKCWQDLATRMGADPNRIHCVPHPIQTDIFFSKPEIHKKDQIISVGRWESYQKDLPRLLRALKSFLQQNPEWSALVVGSGLLAVPQHERIRFLPPLPSRELAHHMRESKIFFSSSRYESFGLAAAEAKACGCLLVSPSGCWLHDDLCRQEKGEDLTSALRRAGRMQVQVSPSPSTSAFSPAAVVDKILCVAGKIQNY